MKIVGHLQSSGLRYRRAAAARARRSSAALGGKGANGDEVASARSAVSAGGRKAWGGGREGIRSGGTWNSDADGCAVRMLSFLWALLWIW